ncbi:tryptophan 7-halogenase [Pseudoalteromonas piscicida]|uniref:NAD(P)/FAD-dependent oxidoreductase n=2 Tax=Pseudoalteromonas TaxID=53246 RepID=UPI001EFC5B71|nr:FAD-dependent monooxygenase [Pseudoalteromonas piscicida]MCG7539018.1 tryptophan 7-halogenase [Pseudoalteromonas sp. OF7H-1]MCG9771283.1 tryptophan 7-halogenase [Pseudoalteromonas piscicida]
MDLVVLGGGMAGMGLALQVRRQLPTIRILVLERNTFPVEESAYKIGESTVEVSSHYFANILGFGQHLKDEHLPKLGQRFFWDNGSNTDISSRLELGCRDFPAADTYQIARGRFENFIIDKCNRDNIDVQEGTKVIDVQIGSEESDHTVFYERAGSQSQVSCRWLVDATGGGAVLKQKLKLDREADHKVSSAWFRVAREVKVDEWSESLQWQERHGSGPERRLSVNHLMGRGYWIWLIPLASGSTSIGLVADEHLHPSCEFDTFEKLVKWMEKHEPQCASLVQEAVSDFQDFGILKEFSRHTTKAYSPDRWFLTGIAGVFVDPFYSPGSDFIAFSNTFITDLICSDHAGDKGVDRRIEAANSFFLSLTDAYFKIFRGQYEIFGNQQVMPLKICWDWSIYWTQNAFIFCQGDYAELPKKPEVWPLLHSFTALNENMQRFFLTWSRLDTKNEPTQEYIDWTECEFLRSLNERLVCATKNTQTLKELEGAFERLSQAAGEMVQAGVNRVPELEEFLQYVSVTGRREHYSYILDKVGV